MSEREREREREKRLSSSVHVIRKNSSIIASGKMPCHEPCISLHARDVLSCSL